MNLIIARTAGFCMGVSRAVDIALDASNKDEKPICSYGPLIHNPQVLGLLKEKGISVINDIPEHGSGTVLIRAHGVPPKIKDDLKKAGFNIVDATCPRVIKVQSIIHKHAGQGYASIIVGDRDHPEVKGLLGYAGGNGFVVDTLEALDSLPAFDKAIIVAQTTQNTRFFEAVKQWVAGNFPHYKIFNTICDSTEKRQAEVNRLAKSVDAVIVVGGHNSGNTQRLAEIAGQTGKPTFHIETESELDVKALSSIGSIGITAGASTPNWIIKRVYRTLETLLYKRKQGWHKALFVIQRFLVLTNIYVALGAGCLSYACTRLQGIEHHFSNILIAAFYVLSMHTFNNLLDGKADRYNDPDRVSFYQKNKAFLAVLAIIAGGAGLFTAYGVGPLPFFLLLAMSIMGLLYNSRLLPKRVVDSRYRRIRDIPGSKTVLIAAAWGIVTAVFPALHESNRIGLSTGLVFVLSTGLVFVRTALFDIFDMQGNRIVGKETIPTLLGAKSTLRLLRALLLMIFFVLLLSSQVGLVSSLGFALGVSPALMLTLLYAYERGYLFGGFRLEFLVETNFVLAGIISLIWSVL
jgi:(E)-4-hydroxy-3-methyl-but-2-enyl pyrophosphate reductase